MTIIGAHLIQDDPDGPMWLDTGGSTMAGTNRFRVVAKSRNLLAVKVHGCTYFGGLAQPRHYAPASFMVFECSDSEHPDDPEALWSQRLNIPVRS